MKEEGRWITINGTHVFVKEGQSVMDAFIRGSYNKNKGHNNKVDDLENVMQKLEEKKYHIKGSWKKVDKDFLAANLNQFEKLRTEYEDVLIKPYNYRTGFGIKFEKIEENTFGRFEIDKGKITLNSIYFEDKEKCIQAELRGIESGWHVPVEQGNEQLYTVTHEFGHYLEHSLMKRYNKGKKEKIVLGTKFDNILQTEYFNRMKSKTGESSIRIREKYFSGYSKSKGESEWFAEIFTQSKLGKSDVSTQTLTEIIDDIIGGRM